MAGCKSNAYSGKDVALEYALACGDVDPLGVGFNWLPLGAMRTKEFGLTWDTTDASSDQSIGALRENIATFKSLTISGDGVAYRTDTARSNLKALTKHVFNPGDDFADQPVAWLRMTFPDLTFIAYMIINDLSRSAPHDDVVTFSLEATATTSDFGLIILDTPSTDTPVTSVTLQPPTITIPAGASVQLLASVQPTDAVQGVTYTSGTPAAATVSSSGLVTAIAAGTSTITAKSTVDPTKEDTCVVTVT